MDNTAKFRIIFRDYPEKFVISNKRRAKYYKQGDKLPGYIQNNLLSGKYDWLPKGKNKEIYLFNKELGAFEIKNKKSVGTPRMQVINSQLLWEGGAGSEWVRLAIEEYLSSWYTPAILRQLPEQIWTREDEYIHLEYIFYYPFEDKESWTKYQDYINHCFIRSKVFEDTLVKMKIIKDDGPKYVRGGYMRYVDIPAGEEKHMDVVIHFCKNNEKI